MRPFRARSSLLIKFLDSWPGKSLGVYRFLPVFFVLGGLLEFAMINWTVGETNFYRVYRRNQAEFEALQSIRLEQSGVDNSAKSDSTKSDVPRPER